MELKKETAKELKKEKETRSNLNTDAKETQQANAALTEENALPVAVVEKEVKEEAEASNASDVDDDNNNATAESNVNVNVNVKEEGEKKEKREKNNRRREPKIVNSRAALFGDAPAATSGMSGRDKDVSTD
jgi:hypothetical protein